MKEKKVDLPLFCADPIVLIGPRVRVKLSYRLYIYIFLRLVKMASKSYNKVLNHVPLFMISKSFSYCIITDFAHVRSNIYIFTLAYMCSRFTYYTISPTPILQYIYIHSSKLKHLNNHLSSDILTHSSLI